MNGMYDTLVLRIPILDLSLIPTIMQFMRMYESVVVDTGEQVYCFTSGELEGSYDYRIRIKLDNRHWVKPEGCMVPIAVEGDYYLEVECSIHKLLNNHNVYGGPKEIRPSVKYLQKFLESSIGIELPSYLKWSAVRIDIAKLFVLNNSNICSKIIQNLKRGNYSRRKLKNEDYGIYFNGSTTHDKFYWKGMEFKEHDYKRFMKYIMKKLDKLQGTNNADLEQHKLALFQMKIDKVMERAMRTIRFECEIKSRTLEKLFGEDTLVENLTDESLNEVMENELRKIFMEREDMEMINRSDLVEERLDQLFSPQLAASLYSMWAKIVQYGERTVKGKMSKPTFYRNKKLLIDSGISWSCTNINLKQISIVPEDFSFLKDNYVDSETSVEVKHKLESVA